MPLCVHQKAERKKKLKNKGLITDIQRMSIHDGPGIRTTVFFKGCPLSCKWCHNPETISFQKQIMFYQDKCIGCGKCSEGCYAGAKVVCGKEYTPEQLLEEILIDKDYFSDGGGVTFSGGEPLAQKEFLKQIITLCKQNGIGCCVETSLIYFDEEVFSQLDLVMADLKIWDEDVHREYTGVSNKDIKEHFVMLDKVGVPIIARTPVIPEIEQGIEKISQFMKGLKNVKKYELLPYNSLGESKRIALGKDEIKFSVPTQERMKELNEYAFTRE